MGAGDAASHVHKAALSLCLPESRRCRPVPDTPCHTAGSATTAHCGNSVLYGAGHDQCRASVGMSKIPAPLALSIKRARAIIRAWGFVP